MSEALLITGVFGVGKTSVVEELAQRLEDAGRPYAALDLDWLMWFDAGLEDDAAHRVFLANLSAMITNYRKAGVERFVMALHVPHAATLESLRDALAMPLSISALTTPLETGTDRLSGDPTVGRSNDLAASARQIAGNQGAGLKNATFSNYRPISETAEAVAAWMGWEI